MATLKRCDICDKDFTIPSSNFDIIGIELPLVSYHRDRFQSEQGRSKKDICIDCYNKLCDFLDSLSKVPKTEERQK